MKKNILQGSVLQCVIDLLSFLKKNQIKQYNV